ncbi:hypothetical protein LCGC14_1755840, partial [marine sediment metagenome]
VVLLKGNPYVGGGKQNVERDK